VNTNDSKYPSKLIGTVIVLAVIVVIYVVMETTSYFATHYRQILGLGADVEKQSEILSSSQISGEAMPDVPYFTDDMDVVSENLSYLPNNLKFQSYTMWGNKPELLSKLVFGHFHQAAT